MLINTEIFVCNICNNSISYVKLRVRVSLLMCSATCSQGGNLFVLILTVCTQLVVCAVFFGLQETTGRLFTDLMTLETLKQSLH